MQAPVGRVRPTSNEDDAAMQLLQKRTEVVNRFAAALSGSRPSQTAIASLFSATTKKDSIALTIPSLELELPASNEEENNKDVLPTIGEHHSSNGGIGDEGAGVVSASSSVVADEQEQPSRPRPNMTASVLASHPHAALDSSSSSMNDAVDPAAAQASLSHPISWTQSTLPYASAAVSSNLAQSFQSLTASRLKSWTLVVLRHSLSTGSAQSRSRLMRIVSTKIQVETTTGNGGSAGVQFKTLPLPVSALGLKPKDADCILPLLFEVEVNVGTGAGATGKQPVLLRCPGTISCKFGSNPDDNCKLTIVNVSLDTEKMMKSMIDQARLVVLKAVSSATNSSPPEDVPKTRDDSSLRSSLNPHNSCKDAKTKDDIRAMKARSSAQRLNSILQGKPYVPAAPLRKVNTELPQRSGLSLGALAPVPKKPRLVQTANRLKSFKSFGRPHAGDFGSGPRNATFGEFGGHGGSWGRNGRLAEHPQPMHLGTTPDKNETFAANSTTTTMTSGTSAALLLLRGTHVEAGGVGIKRSPTALEHSLLQKYGR